MEPPIVDFCQSPPIFLVTNPQDLGRKKALVSWDPPIFHDNSLKDLLDLTLTIENGGKAKAGVSSLILSMGETTLNYEATDEAGNTAKCTMKIKLQGNICFEHNFCNTINI